MGGGVGEQRSLNHVDNFPIPTAQPMKASPRLHAFAEMIVLCAAVGTLVHPGMLQAQSASKRGDVSSTGPSTAMLAGQNIFANACAGCHGLDAHGGERAPDIVAKPEVQRMTEAEISHVVREGSRSKAMPAFGNSLDSGQLRDVVIYVRSLLQGNSQSAVLPGDSAAGKSLFFGKAGCADCHVIEGAGGFLGADLTNYAGSRSASETRDAITDPTASVTRHDRMVAVTARDGQQFTGIARNEDNFSLQLQTADGTFHLLMKSDLEKVEYQRQPLMPADYGQRFSAGELNDLVSFLMKTAAANAKAEPEGRTRKDPDED